MKTKLEKPSPKPTKTNLIHNMLTQTLAHIKIKKEVLTEYESESNEMKTPSKSKVLKKKMNKSQNDNSESLDTSVNIKTEVQDVSNSESLGKTLSKHKRKSLDKSTSQDVQSGSSKINDSVMVTKKSSNKSVKSNSKTNNTSINNEQSKTSDESPSMPKTHRKKEHARLSKSPKVDKHLHKTKEGQLVMNYQVAEAENSDDDISVPKLKQIKEENSNSHKPAGTLKKSLLPNKVQEQNSESDSAEEEVSVPKPKQVKTEDFNTANKIVVNQQSSDSDSSDDEVKVPKPKQIKIEGSRNSEIAAKTKPSPQKIMSVSHLSSEMTVPKPKKIKTEVSKSTSHFKIGNIATAEKVTVPKKSKSSAKPSPKRNVPVSKTVREENSDSESSEEVTVPKPKKVKTENSQSLSGKSVGINTKPSSRRDHINHQISNSDSSEEEITVPRPKVKTEIQSVSTSSKSALKAKQSPKSKVLLNKGHSQQNSSDSSEDEVTVPKPKHIKMEEAGFPTTTHQDSQSESSEEELTVPRPIVKTEIQSVSTNSKSALKAKQSPKSKVLLNKGHSQQNSSDSSEDEVTVPKPKQMKMEEAQFSITTHQDSQSESSDEEVTVPKPKKVKAENPQSAKLSSNASASKAAIREQSFESDSSEEEITVPKPKKLKNEQFKSSGKVTRLAEVNTKQSPKSKMSADSSDEEVTVPKPKQLKIEDPLSEIISATSSSKSRVLQNNSSAREENSSSESSEEEVTVPKPKQVKIEESKASKTVTKPFKRNNVSISEPVNRKSSDSSSSDEEVAVPKPKQIKAKYSQIQKSVNIKTSENSELDSSENQVSMPGPKQIRTQLSQSSKVDAKVVKTKPSPKNNISTAPPESESSEEEETVPTPKKVKNKISESVNSHETLNQIKNAAELISKSILTKTVDRHSGGETPRKQLLKNNESGTESESSEDLPMPKPLQVKPEKQIMDTPNQHNKKKRKQITEISELTNSGVKNGRSASLMTSQEQLNLGSSSFTTGNQSEDQSNSESESTSTKRQNEDSDSETEMPKPKRIKMEDINEIIQYKGMSWKEKLKYKYPRIEGEQKSNLSLANSQVISLLLIPKTINPQWLKGNKLHTDKPKTIRLNDKEYVLEPMPKKPDPIVINLNETQLVQPQGTLCLEASVPQMSLREFDVPMGEKVHLPNDLKTRHPLFGFSYKSPLSIDKSVSRQLEEAVEMKAKEERKEAKKKRKLKRQQESNGVEESVLNMFNAINSNKVDETDQQWENNNVEGHREKKRKRSSNSDAAGSVLSNPTKKPKSRKSCELLETLPVENKHKMKKRKSL